MDKSILKYNREIYVAPFDKGDVMYFETALPIEGEEISLLYPISEVLFVTNYGLNIIYEEGKDYLVKNGKIIIPSGSKIKQLSIDEYYLKDGTSFPLKISKEHCPYKFNEDRFVLYGEGDFFTKNQIAVTYKHLNTHSLYSQVEQRDKLPNFFNKISKNHEASILFYGDSITVGCNSSGTEYGNNTSPYAESWPVMVSKTIEDRCKTKINYINTAVGGTTTEWGRDNYKERVNKYHPDLLVLAFGMNDPWNKDKHISLIKEIVNGVREDNPDCDVILISTSVPNQESEQVKLESKYFYEEYEKLDIDRVAVVNMTKAHLDILKYKKFKDMTGNNVNHPNDFLARLYAQSILKVLGL